MVVKIELDPQTLQRLDALSPLAKRATVAKRLVMLGLAAAEQHPDALRAPRPVASAQEK